MINRPFCSTKHERITNARGSVKFPCPGCNSEIVRSSHARKLGAQYVCPNCQFLGPN
ncbi:MAG: zinc finger domain-containing protein [Nanoarchaeota archaeon]|nr:zinc finger domain-containing protein [Nanoarchaeota archaeon]